LERRVGLNSSAVSPPCGRSCIVKKGVVDRPQAGRCNEPMVAAAG
jgi:hypothetical protein